MVICIDEFQQIGEFANSPKFQTSIIRPCTHAGGMLMSVHWRG